MSPSRVALITGASSGLGAEFAKQLAARGYDLILVARRQELLEALASQLREQFGVHSSVIVADLSNDRDIQRVEQAIIKASDLEILVNNAGFGVRGLFINTELEKYVNMLAVHVIVSVRLSHVALQEMAKRGSGSVIFVSTVASFTPLPGNAVYSATKAFLNAFGEALKAEMGMKYRNIRIQILCPGFTYTGFHDTPEYQGKDVRKSIPRFLWMDADKVVKASLRALDRNQLYCVPGFFNRIAVWSGRIGLTPFIAKIIMGGFRKQ